MDTLNQDEREVFEHNGAKIVFIVVAAVALRCKDYPTLPKPVTHPLMHIKGIEREGLLMVLALCDLRLVVTTID